jgi:sugar phosphate isomerase/epimerase
MLFGLILGALTFGPASAADKQAGVGTGVMDWPAILQAAKKAGVAYYFIEDESDTVEEHIPRSLKFLEQVTW